LNPLPNLFFQNVGQIPLESRSNHTIYVICFVSGKICYHNTSLNHWRICRAGFWHTYFFMVLFILLVYAPLAHMTWHPDGIFFKMGVLDFAGGTVVHMSWIALAGAIFLGKENTKVNPARIILCFTRNRFAMVWMVWF
jgi:Amt family ammonium transporter